MILLPSTGAVYLTVVNPGAADRLVRVETPAARRAELHESVLEKDMMRMVAHPDGFAVPAGGTLELKPGGKHLMLVDLQGHPGTGEKVPLTLHFACAGAITVAAEVSPP
jgi:copper(I)-binding protein